MIRMLIVDDSAFMRKAIQSMVEDCDDIEVVGTARNGAEGLEKMRTLRPHVITLDVEMPVMNGLDTLAVLMEKMPTPVIMFSTFTKEGAEVTLRALSLGAVDYLPKEIESGYRGIMKFKDVLIEKIRAASKARPVAKSRGKAKPAPLPAAPGLQSSVRRNRVVAIGASTGGPSAIETILAELPAALSYGVLIAQHMPGSFTPHFAKRLDQLSPLAVREAGNGDEVSAGVVYIAPGNSHMIVEKKGTIVRVKLVEEASGSRHRPSIDKLFVSVAETYRVGALGVVLTGMGEDGLEGVRALKKAGGKVFVQDRSTSVVYGMPGAVVQERLADSVVALGRMAETIVRSH